jgi:enoyl-CoA hydratase
MDELDTRLTSLDEKVDAVVLTGTGSCFSAGLDLQGIADANREQLERLVASLNRASARLYALPLPVVAAIQGHAIAGGLILALCCDYRVAAAHDCKIGLTEVRVGVPFPAAALAVLRAELDPGTARVLMLGGRNIDSATALARGVVDELHSREQVLPRALHVAQDLSQAPRGAYAEVKRQLRREALRASETMLASGNDPALPFWFLPDVKRTVRAVLSKQRDT